MKKISTVTNWLVSTTTGLVSAVLCDKLIGNTTDLPVAGMVGVSAAYGTHIAIDSYNDSINARVSNALLEYARVVHDMEILINRIDTSEVPADELKELLSILAQHGFVVDDKGVMSVDKDSALHKTLYFSSDEERNIAILKDDMKYLVKLIRKYASSWGIKVD